MTKPIYLDYAAATPVASQVLAAMQPYFADEFYNPAATYLNSQAVKRVVDDARSSVAAILGARRSEVVFTPGATAANQTVFQSVMAQHPGKKVLVSSVEHPSILNMLNMYSGKEIPVNPDGAVDLRGLERMVDADTVLVSVMYANNEVGTIQPLREVGRLVAKIRENRRKASNTLPLYLHSDASQAAGYLDLHVSRLGVDLMVLNGAKIYGPKQTGVLYVRTGVPVSAHTGTDNVPGIVGFAAALELAQSMRHEEDQRLEQLQRIFFDLLEHEIPSVIINGSRKHRLAGNMHVTIPGQDNERMLLALDEAGIMAAAGSACLASSEEPSHVLKAMGLSDAAAQSSLRFTMGRGTTEAEIRRAVDTLARIVA